MICMRRTQVLVRGFWPWSTASTSRRYESTISRSRITFVFTMPVLGGSITKALWVLPEMIVYMIRALLPSSTSVANTCREKRLLDKSVLIYFSYYLSCLLGTAQNTLNGMRCIIIIHQVYIALIPCNKALNIINKM